MTLLGRSLLILALILIIAAFWISAHAWSLAGTAGVLFIVGASILGNRPKA